MKAARIQKKDVETAIELYLKLLYKYECSCEKKKVTEEAGKISADALKIYKFTKACLENFELNYEDMLVVGYIRILIGGIRPMEQISHVVLDEAQDYNRLQLVILKALYPKSRFTILADANQAVYPEISTVDMGVFHQIFSRNMKDIVLNKSYRSTAPINKFTFDILGIHNPELYVDRHGKEPECISAAEMKDAVHDIISQVPQEKSIAILTCDKESAMNVKQALGKFIDKSDRKIEYILKIGKIYM